MKILKFRATSKHENFPGLFFTRRDNGRFSWDGDCGEGFSSEESILGTASYHNRCSVYSGDFEIYEIEHNGAVIKLGDEINSIVNLMECTWDVPLGSFIVDRIEKRCGSWYLFSKKLNWGIELSQNVKLVIKEKNNREIYYLVCKVNNRYFCSYEKQSLTQKEIEELKKIFLFFNSEADAMHYVRKFHKNEDPECCCCKKDGKYTDSKKLSEQLGSFSNKDVEIFKKYCEGLNELYNPLKIYPIERQVYWNYKERLIDGFGKAFWCAEGDVLHIVEKGSLKIQYEQFSKSTPYVSRGIKMFKSQYDAETYIKQQKSIKENAKVKILAFKLDNYPEHTLRLCKNDKYKWEGENMPRVFITCEELTMSKVHYISEAEVNGNVYKVGNILSRIVQDNLTLNLFDNSTIKRLKVSGDFKKLTLELEGFKGEEISLVLEAKS